MLEEDFGEEQLKQFMETLPPAVLAAMAGVLNVLAKEVIGTIHKEHDVLFCGSNGQNVVKCLHYDRSVLNGEDGPVIIASANPMVILAAYSNEYIERKVDEYRNLFSDPELMEVEWQLFLNSLAEDIALHHSGEEVNWEKLLNS
jgi:hypothetical protein|tara:strand:+ start:1437 stop:1868 length:432 start_codon:yes stop_codon:yes gene_type:complete